MTNVETGSARERVLVALSPRHRRWARLKSELRAVAGPVSSHPSDRDFVICGLPRSGTSLAAAVLHVPPRSAVVMEPWDAFRLPPAELFRSLRNELAGGSLHRGRLDLEVLERDGEVRWQRESGRAIAVPWDADSQLGVKIPSWWQYLPYLPETRFVVCVRDPAEVVRSFAQQSGTLRHGLEYDLPFNAGLNVRLRAATTDVAARRIALYDAIVEGLLPHLARDNVFVLRYEDWCHRASELQRDLAAFIGVPNLRADVQPRPPARGPDDDADDAVRAASSTANALGYGP